MLLHNVVGPAIGSSWNNLDTDWEAIAPAVRWWLDLLAELVAGRITEDVVELFQEFGKQTLASALPRDWQAQIEGLKRAQEAYPVTIRELQSALDIDNQLRFGNSSGLTSLMFREQQQTLGVSGPPGSRFRWQVRGHRHCGPRASRPVYHRYRV